MESPVVTATAGLFLFAVLTIVPTDWQFLPFSVLDAADMKSFLSRLGISYNCIPVNSSTDIENCSAPLN